VTADIMGKRWRLLIVLKVPILVVERRRSPTSMCVQHTSGAEQGRAPYGRWREFSAWPSAVSVRYTGPNASMMTFVHSFLPSAYNYHHNFLSSEWKLEEAKKQSAKQDAK